MFKSFTLSCVFALTLSHEAALAHGCRAFKNPIEQQRLSLFATFIRANWDFPRNDYYLQLKGFSAFLRNPVPTRVLIAPVTNNELEELRGAMHAAHTAFGVTLSEPDPNSPTVLSEANLETFPNTNAIDTLRRLVRLIQMLRPDFYPDLDASYFAWGGQKLTTREDLLVAIDDLLLGPTNTEFRTQLSEIGNRINANLNKDEVKQSAKAFRLEVKRLVKLGYKGEELSELLRPLMFQAIREIRADVKKEFQPSFPTSATLWPFI